MGYKKDMSKYENLEGWERCGFGEQLDRWAEKYGERTAVTDSEDEISYMELKQKADCLAAAFLRKGILKGDKVLVQLPNRISFVIVFFALSKIGAVPIMMLPAHREAELEGIIELAKPAAYIVVEKYLGFSYVPMANAMKEKYSCIRHIFIDSESGDISGIIALEPSAYMRTAFMARLMEHNEVKERISLLPIDVGKYSFRDKISGVMCMGVLGHLKRDEQEKLLYKLDKNLNINVPILIELLEPKFLVAPVGSRISVATQGRLRYETYITDIKQVGMDQWTWRLTYKVFCGKNIVSTVDSLMSWNYQSVEKILNQLTKMHFRTAKLSETLLLAIKAR